MVTRLSYARMERCVCGTVLVLYEGGTLNLLSAACVCDIKVDKITASTIVHSRHPGMIFSQASTTSHE